MKCNDTLLPNVYVKSRSSVHIASTVEHLQTLDPPQRVAQQPPPPRPPPRRPLLLLAQHAAHGLVKQVAQPEPAQRRALVVVTVERLRNILRLYATVYSYCLLDHIFASTNLLCGDLCLRPPEIHLGAHQEDGSAGTLPPHLGDPLGLDAVQTVLVLHGEADQEHVLGENVIITDHCHDSVASVTV